MAPNKIIEILIYAGIVQGILLAIGLPRITKANKYANGYLAAILALASVFTFAFYNIVFLVKWHQRLIPLLDVAPYIFSLLSYFYVRSFLGLKNQNKWFWVHLIPLILKISYDLFYFKYSEDEFISNFIAGKFRNSIIIGFCLLYLAITLYTASSLRLFLKTYKKEPEISLKQNNKAFLSIYLGLLSISYIIFFVFNLDFLLGIQFLPFTNVHYGWIVFPVLIYTISFFVLFKPEAMRLDIKIPKRAVVRMKDNEINQYLDKLEQIMAQDQLYLDPKLKLTDMATQLELDATRLSWLINEKLQSNFYDFVNKHRVLHFVDKVKNNEHHHKTLLAMAYEVGFNSKTTFNTYFKKIMGETPSNFVKKTV